MIAKDVYVQDMRPKVLSILTARIVTIQKVGIIVNNNHVFYRTIGWLQLCAIINLFSMQTLSINFQIPSNWAELGDKQLRYVFLLLAQDFSTDELKTLCLLQWSDTKVIGRRAHISSKKESWLSLPSVALSQVLSKLKLYLRWHEGSFLRLRPSCQPRYCRISTGSQISHGSFI